MGACQPGKGTFPQPLSGSVADIYLQGRCRQFEPPTLKLAESCGEVSATPFQEQRQAFPLVAGVSHPSLSGSQHTSERHQSGWAWGWFLRMEEGLWWTVSLRPLRKAACVATAPLKLRGLSRQGL